MMSRQRFAAKNVLANRRPIGTRENSMEIHNSGIIAVSRRTRLVSAKTRIRAAETARRAARVDPMVALRYE